MIIFVFTIEYILRFIAHSQTWSSAWKFAKSPLGIIDLLAVIPYYVELLTSHRSSTASNVPVPGPALDPLRNATEPLVLPKPVLGSYSSAHLSYVFRTTILKMFRLFRMFRVFKHSSLLQLSIEVLIIALKKSVDALSALLFFALMTIVLFSTLMYFAERGTWDPLNRVFLDGAGRPSRFDSIPASFWFVVVTLTTTGYRLFLHYTVSSTKLVVLNNCFYHNTRLAMVIWCAAAGFVVRLQ
jgi:hypothetical protein